jgi:hypothetical protein
MLLGVGAAQAQTTTNTFDTPIVTGPEAPGVWYTDRFAPAGFTNGIAGGHTALIESISGADFQATPFYNTQGRALDITPGAVSLSIDLLVADSYVGSNQRLAGLWGVANDGTSVSAYPIVELSDLGGSLVFRGWDTDLGVWNNLATATTGWHTLGITLGGMGGFTYSLDGLDVGTAPGEGSATMGAVILQGYNAGASYDIAWDNLTTTIGSVPEPSTWAFLILGFGGVGAAMRRKAARPVTA